MTAASTDKVALCECGCGLPAPIATQTAKRFGWVKGMPMRFARGHNTRRFRADLCIDKSAGLDSCWPWTGRRDRKGYGEVYHDGRKARAHRVVFESMRGPIPEGMQLDHLCRNKGCVNPAHLEPVTNAENCRRKPSSKLTADIAATIRTSSDDALTLAQRYGVSRTMIYWVRNGRVWQSEGPRDA